MKVKDLMKTVTSATIIHAYANGTIDEYGEKIGSFPILDEFTQRYGDCEVLEIYPESKDYLYVNIAIESDAKEKEIKTNLGQDYPILNKERKTMTYEKMQWVLDDGGKYKHLEGDHRMYERLLEKGYTTITFYRVKTSVRGLYEIVAYCK